MKECCFLGVCCLCRKNTSPGSGGGMIESQELNGHHYCLDCYPKMVNVHIANLKMELQDVLAKYEELIITIIDKNIQSNGILRKVIKGIK